MLRVEGYSDLHLEFQRGKDLWIPNSDGADVLILAGDIDVGFRELEWRKELLKKYKNVIEICGNHTFYKENHTKIMASLKETQNKINNFDGYTFEGITALGTYHIMENESIVIDGVRFLCATLWTDYQNKNPLVMMECERSINDFRLIKVGPEYKRFTPLFAYYLHKESVRWLTEQLALIGSWHKTVVITHMAPSEQSINPTYKGDPTNGHYASALDELISNADIAWHGHIHSNSDYMIGNCRVICNPRGYANKDFKNPFVLEV